jgi:hypothetical protein
MSLPMPLQPVNIPQISDPLPDANNRLDSPELFPYLQIPRYPTGTAEDGETFLGNEASLIIDIGPVHFP